MQILHIKTREQFKQLSPKDRKACRSIGFHKDNSEMKIILKEFLVPVDKRPSWANHNNIELFYLKNDEDRIVSGLYIESSDKYARKRKPGEETDGYNSKFIRIQKPNNVINIYTKLGHRNKGYGSKLIKHVKKYSVHPLSAHYWFTESRSTDAQKSATHLFKKNKLLRTP